MHRTQTGRVQSHLTFESLQLQHPVYVFVFATRHLGSGMVASGLASDRILLALPPAGRPVRKLYLDHEKMRASYRLVAVEFCESV